MPMALASGADTTQRSSAEHTTPTRGRLPAYRLAHSGAYASVMYERRVTASALAMLMLRFRPPPPRALPIYCRGAPGGRWARGVSSLVSAGPASSGQIPRYEQGARTRTPPCAPPCGSLIKLIRRATGGRIDAGYVAGAVPWAVRGTEAAVKTLNRCYSAVHADPLRRTVGNGADVTS